VRAAAVIDRIGAPPFPFVLNVPRETTAGSTGYWLAAGAGVPVRSAVLDTLSLPRHGVGALFVLDEELLRLASPAHERALRNILVAGLAAYLNQQFRDPRIAAVTDVSPASISSGTTEITSTGATASAINTDLQSMLNAVSAELASPVWIMRRKDSIYLAGLHHANGGQQFPGTPRELFGIPIITTSAMPADAGSPASDRYVLLLDGAQVALADDGRVDVSVSKVTSVEMVATPTVDSATPTPAAMTPMWQTSSVAVKITRRISWARTYDDCCAWMRVSW
jgi:HK97 family phage major capsid protein